MFWGLFLGNTGAGRSGWAVFLSQGQKIRNLVSESVFYQGEEAKDYPGLYSIENNSLAAISAPRNLSFQAMGALASGYGVGQGTHDETGISEHIVEQGDTISSIAEQFGISQNTILWANDLKNGSVISPGQKLVILPTTGIMHIVRSKDTVSQLAQNYKVERDEIIAFNNLSEDGEIFVGDILIVPNARKPVQIQSAPASLVALPNSYFISPVPSPYRITQGLHWYNAIDLSTGKCGSPVYAAAGGQIQRAGYDNRAGNYVRMLHPNGVVTFYGHLSSIAVRAGQTVSQGTVIGYIGHTGHTIPDGPGGCHLHFDVRGARNPFAY